MDPITMSLISTGINVGSGILGEWLASADSEQEAQYRRQALAGYMGISLPELEDLIAQQQGPTNLAGITTDPALDAYQDESQERLADVARSGGLDARARARLEQTRMEAAQAERSSREGVLADARARGTLGTGEELSALLQTGQSSADRARMSDVATLGDAEERALQAIIANGSMAAQRQSTQWGQKAQVATAQDAIDRFNTSTANDFTQFNAQQRQQGFQNQLQLAQAQGGALNRQADYYGQKADRTRQMVGGIGQAAGYGVGAAAQSPMATPAPGAVGAQGAPLNRKKVR